MAQKNNGCGFWALGTLLVILGVYVSYLVIGWLSHLTSYLFLGSTPHLVHMTFVVPALLIELALLEAIFMLIQPGGLFSGRGAENEAQRAKIKKGRKIGVICCASAAVLVILFSSCCFVGWTEEGIDTYVVGKVRSVRYEEMEKATAGVKQETFSFDLTAPDGKTYSLFGVISTGNTAFAKEYNHQFRFAARLSGQLRRAGVPIEVENRAELEKIYKEPYPDTWVFLEEILDGTGS